ncbi:MAG TPA: hypothetical protein VIW29_18960 [Polyangiaceae bacterium]
MVVGAVALGCGGGGGDDDDKDLSQLTPAQLCQEKCAVQVAPNCERTPPDYATSCAMICLAKYEQFPSCTAAARAFDTCAAQKMSFSCVDGLPIGSPQGACAAPGLACISCTGDFINCL